MATHSDDRSEDARQQQRARREQRREKQRLQNVVRAKQMHAARKSGTFPLSTEIVTAATGSLHIGCSGCYYWHWKGQFYPEELPSSRWFDYYASKFRTVELNAPFYSWPTVNTVRTWVRQAGRRRFVYTVKVSELITHIKRFTGTQILIRDFGLIADILGSRMGCLLFQLPPSFHYSRRALERIVSQLDPVRKNVVEFRHHSWWNQTVFAAFREAGIIFCSCSGPRLPDELVKTADDVYLRFHGTKRWYRHDYSTDELMTWAQRIEDSGAKRVWAYFNNDREGFAIKNARQLARTLKQRKQPG